MPRQSLGAVLGAQGLFLQALSRGDPHPLGGLDPELFAGPRIAGDPRRSAGDGELGKPWIVTASPCAATAVITSVVPPRIWATSLGSFSVWAPTARTSWRRFMRCSFRSPDAPRGGPTRIQPYLWLRTSPWNHTSSMRKTRPSPQPIGAINPRRGNKTTSYMRDVRRRSPSLGCGQRGRRCCQLEPSWTGTKVLPRVRTATTESRVTIQRSPDDPACPRTTAATLRGATARRRRRGIMSRGDAGSLLPL